MKSIPKILAIGAVLGVLSTGALADVSLDVPGDCSMLAFVVDNFGTNPPTVYQGGNLVADPCSGGNYVQQVNAFSDTVVLKDGNNNVLCTSTPSAASSRKINLTGAGCGSASAITYETGQGQCVLQVQINDSVPGQVKCTHSAVKK